MKLTGKSTVIARLEVNLLTFQEESFGESQGIFSEGTQPA
jgi:hypothetical protein